MTTDLDDQFDALELIRRLDTYDRELRCSAHSIDRRRPRRSVPEAGVPRPESHQTLVVLPWRVRVVDAPATEGHRLIVTHHHRMQEKDRP